MDWDGAVAVVTGGASGIGRASALAFAAAGADVVVADINESRTQDVAEEIERLGRRALALRVDVGHREEVEELVDRAITWQEHCDLFFSNAGISVLGPPHQIPLADWDAILNINLWAHIWAVRSVLPHMIEQGSGYLVHTSSGGGLIGANPWIAPYVVTKFGIVGLAESLAIYCSDKNIGVSVVCPGLVATNIADTSRVTWGEEIDEGEDRRRREEGRELQETAGIPPERVAEAIVEAVNEHRFYVFSNPEFRDVMRLKWQEPEEFLRGIGQMWKGHMQVVEPNWMISGSRQPQS